eukprot:5653146-Prymnesium_polylepis.1
MVQPRYPQPRADTVRQTVTSHDSQPNTSQRNSQLLQAAARRDAGTAGPGEPGDTVAVGARHGSWSTSRDTFVSAT